MKDFLKFTLYMQFVTVVTFFVVIPLFYFLGEDEIQWITLPIVMVIVFIAQLLGLLFDFIEKLFRDL